MDRLLLFVQCGKHFRINFLHQPFSNHALIGKAVVTAFPDYEVIKDSDF